MKLKDLKIGSKIVTGFSLLSVIGIIIGITGIIGLKNVGDLLNTVSDVRLMGIEHLGDMESNLERIHKGYIQLNDPRLERNEREQVLMDISTSREKYLEAQEAYGELEQTDEEEKVYDQLIRDLEEWQNVNTQQVERLNTRFIETGLLDPVNLMGKVENFRSEHYLLQKKVLDALHNDVMFEGGGDVENCELFQWMSDFRTENSEIKSYLRELREPHNDFHSSVETIKVHIDQGETQQALSHYRNVMQPAAEKLFDNLGVIVEEASRAEDIFNRMSQAINVESSEYHSGVMADISELIRISRKMAEEENALGDKIYQASNLMIVLAVLIGMVIGVVLSYVITRSITGGISKGVKMAESIAKGDLTQEVDAQFMEKKDEVGQLARALQHMSEQLRKIIGEIMGSADNITSASQEMSSTSQQMSQGTSEQASSAEEISSSMEEMVANIQQNTDSAMETEKIAVQSAQGIRKGSESSNTTAKSMKEIASKVSIIGDIAYQTNILALNAAVEAARAGEYGEGFAVVAEEVRKLAERSQVAAEEINELSGSGVNVAVETGNQLEAIVPEIEKTSKLVQEIAAGSKEQNSGADQINSAIQQLNQVVQQNAAAAEEMASSSEELSGQAEQMREVVSYFKVDYQMISHKKQSSKPSGKQQSGSESGKENKEESISTDQESKGVDLKMGETEVPDEEFQRF